MRLSSVFARIKFKAVLGGHPPRDVATSPGCEHLVLLHHRNLNRTSSVRPSPTSRILTAEMLFKNSKCFWNEVSGFRNARVPPSMRLPLPSQTIIGLSICTVASVMDISCYFLLTFLLFCFTFYSIHVSASSKRLPKSAVRVNARAEVSCGLGSTQHDWLNRQLLIGGSRQ